MGGIDPFASNGVRAGEMGGGAPGSYGGVVLPLAMGVFADNR